MAEEEDIEKLARSLTRKTKCPNCETHSPLCQWKIVERDHGMAVVTLGFECKKCAHLWEQTVRMRPSSEGSLKP
jgi:hypothetical protein